MVGAARHGFISRHLDPESRLGEVLFGLVMVLSVTLTAGLAVESGRVGVRQLLIAAIGCNIAWGTIDGVMYLMDATSRRARTALLARRVRDAPGREAAIAMVERELNERLGELGTREQQRVLASLVVDALPAEPARGPVLTRDDLFGALASFWLVFISCVPAALPFLIFGEPSVALRVSNAILIGLLFLVGQRWAVHMGASRLWTGLTTLVLGLGMVGLAIALGG